MGPERFSGCLVWSSLNAVIGVLLGQINASPIPRNNTNTNPATNNNHDDDDEINLW
jgi:hypothetical protein